MIERVTAGGHEEVIVLQDAGLQGVIAIHDSRRGAALAATRIHPSASLTEAFGEALDLAAAVTREASMAGLPRGGAAAVFVGPAAAEKSRPFHAAYARVLDRLDGRLLAVGDMGFEARDLVVLARMTRHVGHRKGPGGDAAELTAQGVLEAIRAAADRLESPLDEMHVAIQGLGQVGYRLARRLAAEGCRLSVADIDSGRAERVRHELGAEVVGAEAIAAIEADVFSPNAGSHTLDEQAAASLRCQAVIGAARAVLAQAQVAEGLQARGILYAPDFVACAGGLAALSGDEDEMATQERVAAVGVRLGEVWNRARANAVNPDQAARDMLRDMVVR